MGVGGAQVTFIFGDFDGGPRVACFGLRGCGGIRGVWRRSRGEIGA